MIMNQMEFDEEKQNLRTRMKEIRNAIPDDVRARENEALTSMILNTELYEQCTCILTYVSFGSEVDTKVFIEKAIHDGKKVYVPKTYPASHAMDFFLCEDLGSLKRTPFGILEPEGDPSLLFPYTTHISLDSAQDCMILVPGLAFDQKLGRLGSGGGYYDRYLSRFRKKMAIGMAFSEQIVDEVPMGQEDEPMDLVVTPERAFF